MRIVLTESQYKTLLRRLDDFSIIDREFKLKLRKSYPCDFMNFKNYFDYVLYKTEDRVIEILNKKGILSFDDEKSISLYVKIRKDIQNYIKEELEEYAQEYYKHHKELHCPNR